LAEALPLAEDLAEELGISITALSPNESWLQCNASLAGTNFGDADLARLAPLAANLRWLDLAGTRVTDAGLEQVARMQSLIRLHLERAAITDAGLVFLKDLAELESLNLYGTAVGDVALATLKALPKLRQVYLWQTQVSPEAAKEFAESRRDKAQLAQWETEIRQLREKIASQHVEVELGALAAVPSAESAVPINTICPVSSKLADRTKTLWHEGKLVAFCCDDCKTNFAKDPKPHLAKLTQLANAPPGGLGVKPVNDKCPVSGKAVVPAQTTVYEGKLVAFCCEKCKATFESDPKPHLARLNSALTGTTSDPKP
jgi:YHS domain-containing protein